MVSNPLNEIQSPTEVTLLTATDLHQNQKLYSDLAAAVARHHPDLVALVGDFLHAGEDFGGRISIPECAKILGSLPCKDVIFVRGNHEDESWIDFAKFWKQSSRPLYALNGEVFNCGPLCVVGFPCYMGDETHFLEGRKPLYGAGKWLKRLKKLHGDTMRTLWLLHETPRGTPLSNPDSVVAGNGFWNQAIEHFHPLLTISGHDHVTPIQTNQWNHKIGHTTCVNVGQTNFGDLRYCLVHATFASEQPCLPVAMTVTAYPMGQTVQLGNIG